MDDATGKYLSSDGNTFTFENAPSTKTLFKLKPSKKRREQGIEHSESGLIVFNEDTVELLHFQTQHGVDGIKIEHNATGEFANRTRLQYVLIHTLFYEFYSYLGAPLDPEIALGYSMLVQGIYMQPRGPSMCTSSLIEMKQAIAPPTIACG